MSQTERLYWIDAQIRDGRYPDAKQVSDHFGVSLRTAYKDRDYLLYRVNAPLDYDRERGGWKYTDTTFMLPFLALSEPEAAGLRRSLLAAQEYLGASEAQAINLLIARLSDYIPTGQETPDGQKTESMGGSIQFEHETQVSEVLLNACRKGVRNRQKIWMRYYSASDYLRKFGSAVSLRTPIMPRWVMAS